MTLSLINLWRKLLVVYIQMPNNSEAVEDSVVKEAHDILQKKFCDKEITLLYLNCERGKNDYELREVTNNVIRTCFDYDAYLEKTPFLVNERRLERLFCKIMISTKFMDRKSTAIIKYDSRLCPEVAPSALARPIMSITPIIKTSEVS